MGPIRFHAVMAGLLVAAAGCGGGSASAERNDAVPIPAGATVAFKGFAPSGAQRIDPSVPDAEVHARIQQAIVAELQQRGYTVVDSAQPATFTMTYFLSIQQQAGYGPTAGGIAGPQVGGYKPEGYGSSRKPPVSEATDTLKNVTFEAALVDEKAGRTAWRGVYSGEPQSSAPSQERINAVAKKVFKSLPKVPGTT